MFSRIICMTESGCHEERSADMVIGRLQAVQDELGYIPRESLVEIGKEFDVPLSKLYGIVTFYSFFKLERSARNLIQVCDGTACHVQGAEKISKKLSEKLGVKEGEATSDGRFCFETVRCLGMCSSAPVIKIVDEVHPKVEEDALDSILDEQDE